MEDTRLKKIIVILTFFLLAALWWWHRPHTIKTATVGIEYKYTIKKINAHGFDSLPLIIALHGNGDTMGNFMKTLFADMTLSAKVVLVQGPKEYGSGYAWPMAGPEMKTYGDAFAEIISILSARYPSPAKPVLVGFSGGGCMAYYQAAVHAHLYSTIIPIAGHLDQSIVEETGGYPETARIVALHGKTDQLIHFSAGQSAVGILSELGRDVDMIELSGGHLAVFTSGHEAFKKVLTEAVEKPL